MEQLYKVGIILQAIDQATRPIQNISNATKELEKNIEQTTSKFDKFKEKFSQLEDKAKSFENVASTAAYTMATKSMIGSFAELEDAQKRLQAVMMETGGYVSDAFKKIDEEAQKLGAELPGTTADFYNLAAKMKQLGVENEVLIKGGLRSAAYLGAILKIPYEEAGEYVAKFSQALGIAQDDLIKFTDIVQRTAHLGVTPTEMAYSFAKLSGTLKVLGWQGLDYAKQLTPLVARMIQLGYTGETVGTNLSSVFSSLLDPKKLKAFTEEAAKYGVQLQLLDEQGKLKSPAQLIAEFSKLSVAFKQGAISQQEMYALLGKLTGAGGEDLKMLSTIIIEGVEGYNKMNQAMAKQADLQARMKLISSSLSSAWEAFTGTFTNMLATLGSQLAPTLKDLANYFNDLTDKITDFFQEHQTLAKIIAWSIAGFAVLSATMLALAGAIMIITTPFKMLFTLFYTLIPVIKALAIAFRFLFLSNPVGLFLLVASAVLYLAYRFGILQKIIEVMGRVFRWLWNAIKSTISNIKEYITTHWQSMLRVFLFVNPVFAIIYALKKVIDFVRSINLFDAGRKIIESIVNGMKSIIDKPIEIIKSITQKIRNFLPFSPAKEGALRDIHLTGLRLVQTISSSIVPDPIVSRMSKTMSAVKNAIMLSPAKSVISAIASPTSAPSINMTVNINVSGKVSQAEAKETAYNLEREIRRVLEKLEKEKFRRQY